MSWNFKQNTRKSINIHSIKRVISFHSISQLQLIAVVRHRVKQIVCAHDLYIYIFLITEVLLPSNISIMKIKQLIKNYSSEFPIWFESHLFDAVKWVIRLPSITTINGQQIIVHLYCCNGRLPLEPNFEYSLILSFWEKFLMRILQLF